MLGTYHHLTSDSEYQHFMQATFDYTKIFDFQETEKVSKSCVFGLHVGKISSYTSQSLIVFCFIENILNIACTVHSPLCALYQIGSELVNFGKRKINFT